MTYQYRVIGNDHNVYTVVKYYVSPTMGQCHVGYLKVAATDEATALRVAREAME